MPVTSSNAAVAISVPLLNQAFFERIEVDSEEITGHALALPFHQLAALDKHRGNGDKAVRTKKTPAILSKDGGSYVTLMVVRTGYCANREVLVAGSPLALA